MDKIKLEKVENKLPFKYILNDDIKNKVFPNLEIIHKDDAKELYENIIGSNNPLYIMVLAFLIIFEIALFFTIDLLELLIVSVIVIVLIGFIGMRLIKSIQTINNTEIRYTNLTVSEVKEKDELSYIKVEDKKNNYLIDEEIEVDKKYNIGDEVIFYILSKDDNMTMYCKDTGNNISKEDIPVITQVEDTVEEEEEIL